MIEKLSEKVETLEKQLESAQDGISDYEQKVDTITANDTKNEGGEK